MNGQRVKKDTKNQREYFRVPDRVALGYRVVPTALAVDEHADLDDYVSPCFQALTELHRLDMDARYILRAIAEKDRNVADYLHLVEQKFNVIMRLVVMNNPDADNLSTVDVNLSEGGIEFPATEELAPGTHLALRLCLQPAGAALLLFGRVAHCEASDDAALPYSIGLEFVRQAEPERQVLARHALHLQSQQRKQAVPR